MPPTNTEIALYGFEAFNRGDWEAATRYAHPDLIWVNDEDTARLAGTAVELHGPGELREFWNAFFGLWEEWRMEPGDPIEGEDGRVLVPVQFRGRGMESGVPIEFDFFQVYEIRDAMPTRITNIRDRDAALALAGIADQSSQA